MADSDLRVTRVVCAVADDEMGRIPLEHAILRALRDRHTEVHFVRVLGEGADDQAVEEARQKLVGLVVGELSQLSSLEGEASPALWSHVVAGDPAVEICALCENLAADRLILGPGRRSEDTTAAAIVGRAPCTVEVVRPREHDPAREDERRRRCSLCAEVREASQGHRWFCSDHRSGAEFHRFPIVASQSMQPTSFG